MNETPKTDNAEHAQRTTNGFCGHCVPADFARGELERENAKLRTAMAEIYIALGTREADHTKWPAQIAGLVTYVAALEEQCDSIGLAKARHVAVSANITSELNAQT